MRILHVLHSFPPSSHGGIETYVQALAAAQRAAGDTPLVLCGSDDGPGEPELAEERVGDLTVYRLRPPVRGSTLERLRGVDPALRALVERCLRHARPELVHVHHWHNSSSDLVATVRAAGIAAVVTLHDLFAVCPLFFRLPDDVNACAPEVDRGTCAHCIARLTDDPPQRLEQGFAAREARLREELVAASPVLALSESQARYLRQVPLLRGIEVIAAPLPPPPVPAPRVGWQPGAGLRLVSWGGLVPGKGLHVVVRAAEGLPYAEQVTIEHFGRVLDAGYRQRVTAEARRTRLVLHGSYTADDMARRFPAFDAAVFPSFFLETHGYAIDEALALGLPVLVADRGAPPSRIGTRGVVFPAGDELALREVLQRLLEEPRALAELRRGAAAPAVRMEDHRLLVAERYRRALLGRR